MERSAGSSTSAISRNTRPSLPRCTETEGVVWLSWLDQSLQVDEPMLRQAFNRLFLSLPSFVERYPDIVDVVRSLYFPPKGEGMFAFVEFVDDVLTTTAMQMSGFELQNRSIRIGRPQSYEPPHDGELAGLDVQPLREKGLLPAAPPGEGKEAKEGVANVLREVYFGNLATGMVDEEARDVR